MKRKIKKAAYFAGAFLATAPVMALASGLDLNAGGSTGLPNSSITDIIKNVMNWLLTMIGVFAVIGFAIAGVLYLTSAGDEDRAKKAKGAMVASIWGVIVALVGLVALKFANGLWGASSSF